MMQGTPPTLLNLVHHRDRESLDHGGVQVRPAAGRRQRGRTALLTQVLGLGAAPGATLAVVRKVRTLCWTAAGMVLFFKRGLTARGYYGTRT